MWDPKLMFVDRTPPAPIAAPRPVSERPVVTVPERTPSLAAVRSWRKRHRPSPRTVILRAMGFKNYRAYCASRLWARIRGSVLVLAGGVCQVCHEQPALIVHHLDYEPATMAGESFDALMAVCEPCHNQAHAKPKRGYTGNHRAKQARLTRRQRNRRKLWLGVVSQFQDAKPRLVKPAKTPAEQA